MSYNPANPNGQATMLNSSPVVLASNQNNSLETGGNLATAATNTTTIAGAVVAQGSTTSGQPGELQLGAVTTSPPTYTTAKSSPLSLDTAGNLRTSITNTSLSVSQASGDWNDNIAQIAGSTVATAATGVMQVGIVGNSGAKIDQVTGSTVPTNAIYNGANAVTSENSSTTSGDLVGIVADKVGKIIVLPYANPENFLSTLGLGNTSVTTTASTSLVAAQASGIKVYITGISLSNTGTSTSLVLLQNGSSGTTIWQGIAPAGGGSNIVLPTPICTSAATALYFAAGTATTTLYISVTGYIGK
jgi:hypothetical protein